MPEYIINLWYPQDRSSQVRGCKTLREVMTWLSDEDNTTHPANYHVPIRIEVIYVEA